jgi:hypothetical protein
MKLLTGTEVLSTTAHRLIRYGIVEGQAYALAQTCTLSADASDDVVEDIVLRALVRAKEFASGRARVQYLGGQRRDLLRK